MNPALAELTPLERKYFKLYASAARRDFSVLCTAAALMEQDELGVPCAIQACQMAEELDDLHAKFIGRLALFAFKHKLKFAPLAAPPTDDELTRLIVSAFFKVIAVIHSPYSSGGVQTDAGWFSGSSTDWKKNLAALKTAWATPGPGPFSAILSAFAQLYHLANGNKLPLSHKCFPVSEQLDEEMYEDDVDDPAEPEDFD